MSTAKDENKIKTYKQKAISVHRCKFVLYWQRLTLCHGLKFIVNQKWNNKTNRMTEFELFNYLHSEIKEKKIEIGIEKDGFKAGSKFD